MNDPTRTAHLPIVSNNAPTQGETTVSNTTGTWMTDEDRAELREPMDIPAIEAIADRVVAEVHQAALAPFVGLVDLWAARETTATEYAMYQELRQALAEARRSGLRGGEDRGDD